MKDRSAFYTEQEMERLFQRGIKAGSATKGVSSKDLEVYAASSISNIKNPLTSQEKSALKQAIANVKPNVYHHWYETHPSGHQSLILAHHTDLLGPGKYFDCDLVADKWYKWWLTTPVPNNPYSNPGTIRRDESSAYGADNVFLMQENNTKVYFTTAAPFQEPDEKSVTLTTEANLMVPAYNVFASGELYPALDTDDKLLTRVVGDMFGIRAEHIRAEFDHQPISPCTVIRKKPLRVCGIPNDNVVGIPKDRLNESGSCINIIHGGHWMLVKQDALTPGDHLLEWEVESINYKMHTRMYISNLV